MSRLAGDLTCCDWSVEGRESAGGARNGEEEENTRLREERARARGGQSTFKLRGDEIWSRKDL